MEGALEPLILMRPYVIRHLATLSRIVELPPVGLAFASGRGPCLELYLLIWVQLEACVQFVNTELSTRDLRA